MHIVIPKKLNVGFVNRKDTYSGKLAYITYWDNKGKLRKEVSWQKWRDKKIPNMKLANKPIEGFVLNKRVGGYKTGWNTRATYIRVYDPRGFDINISVDNLLYILESVTCSKNKGLESKFVYGWSGTELVLVPVVSPDYIEHKKFSDKLFNNKFIKTKELKIGSLYEHINKNTYLYLGRSNAYEDNKSLVPDKQKGKTKYFWFKDINSTYKNGIVCMSTVNKKFTGCIGEDLSAVSNATELMMNDIRYKKPGKVVHEYITKTDIVEIFNTKKCCKNKELFAYFDTEVGVKTLILEVETSEYIVDHLNSNPIRYEHLTLDSFIDKYKPRITKYYNEDNTIRYIKGEYN